MTLDLEQTLQKRLDESSARKLSQLVSSHAQNAGADMRAVFFHFAAHDWMTNRFFFVSLVTKNISVCFQAQIKELNSRLQNKLKKMPRRPRETVKELDGKAE